MRLSNNFKTKLEEALIQRAFAREESLLEAETAKLASRLYYRAFSEEELLTMKDIPAGWIPEVSEARVSIGSTLHALPFNGELKWWGGIPGKERMARISRCVPFCKKDVLLLLPPSDPLAIEVDKNRDAWEDFLKKMERCRLRIRAALKNISSSNCLEKEWPEAFEVFRILGLQPIIQDLNRELQL